MTDLIELMCGRPATNTHGDKAWRELLDVADRTFSTPLLRDAPDLSDWFRAEIETRIAKIRTRRARLIETYLEASDALTRAGVEFVVFKGFTHESDAGWDTSLRAQNDIDLLLRESDVDAAQRALLAAGFQFHSGGELSDNHARPMLKAHPWSWRGDYFDPDLPVCVELHHTIWSSKGDRIATPGTELFFDRRGMMDCAGLRVPALRDDDRLCAAALHALRHILRNNVRPVHVFELARMLRRRADDAGFWERWRQSPTLLCSLQSIAFRFAAEWFGEPLPPATLDAFETLPRAAQEWFARFAYSPILNLTRPNKDVLRLHLGLLPRWRDRVAVARRRLLPVRIPDREQANGSYFPHLFARARYHAVALARTGRGAD